MASDSDYSYGVYYQSITNLQNNCVSTAKKIKDEVTALSAKLETLTTCWTGTAHQAYWTAQNQWNTACDDMADVLNGIGKQLGEVEDGYVKTEAAISKMFSSKNSPHSGGATEVGYAVDPTQLDKYAIKVAYAHGTASTVAKKLDQVASEIQGDPKAFDSTKHYNAVSGGINKVKDAMDKVSKDTSDLITALVSAGAHYTKVDQGAKHAFKKDLSELNAAVEKKS